MSIYASMVAASNRRFPTGLIYYFFDPSRSDLLTIVDPEAATKLVSSWSNAATGSNAVTPLALTQSTSNDQPVWDGV
jgi:hypothetical protein